MRDEYSSVISITWEGNYMPNEIRIYGGITSLRVRPFIDNVLQCFACYRSHGKTLSTNAHMYDMWREVPRSLQQGLEVYQL